MDISVFKRSLCNALVERGVAPETAQHHVTALIKTFTDDDIAEISAYSAANTTSAVASIADSISEVLLEKAPAEAPKNEKSAKPISESDAITAEFSAQRSKATASSPKAEKPRPVSERPLREKRREPNGYASGEKSNRSAARAEAPKKQVTKPKRAPKPSHQATENEQGKKKFWTIFWCVSPITAFLAVVFFAAFGFMYAAVAACMIALVVALIAVIAAGSVISLISFIYGIIKLFSVVPEGIYEIGLGFVVMGITMFVGIAIYNIAVRLLPLVFPCIKKLYGYTMIQIKTLYYYIKEECCKL